MPTCPVCVAVIFPCALFSIIFFFTSLLMTIFLSSMAQAISSPELFMDRHGCGETKGCLFKPAGCNPMLDCSIAIMFYVSGRNKLTIQMTAESLVPAPSLQYVAIGFSEDMFMGEDFVTECVLSPDGSAFSDVEVFTSYNLDRTSNDRTRLNSSERALLFDRVQGEMVDGRLYCAFVQTIRPQFSLSSGSSKRIWDLDKKFWIMAATGSAQPDEVNAHDTASGSHFYPIVSSRAIDPSRVGVRYYELPPPFVPSFTNTVKVQDIHVKPKKEEKVVEPAGSAAAGNGGVATQSSSPAATTILLFSLLNLFALFITTANFLSTNFVLMS